MKLFRQIISEVNLRVPCPFCLAPAGQKCSDQNGNYNCFEHEERIESALKAFGERMPPRSAWAGVDRRKKQA